MPRIKYKPIQPIPKYVIDIFLSRIDTSDPDGCWPYTGAKDENGYGVFSMKPFVPKRILAHRMMIFIQTGTDPKEMIGCHYCNNPACLRLHPKHLYIGTHKDNQVDRMRSGTAHKLVNPDYTTIMGEKHYLAKLTEEKVREIRIRHAAGGMYFTDLAREYGVAQNAIIMAVKRKSWKHVL